MRYRRRHALCGAAVALACWGPACGGSPLGRTSSGRDAGGPPNVDASTVIDALDANVADTTVPDLQRPQPLPCSAVRPLAAGGPLTARRTQQALFSRDGRALVLVATSDTPIPGSPSPGDLLIVTLPGGAVTTRENDVRSAAWLGNSDEVLVNRGSPPELVVVPLHADGSRLIARNVCGYLPTPDGSRVYVIRDCNAATILSGVLDEVATGSGIATRLSAAARPGHLAVSPSGRHVAYVAPPAVSDASWSDGGVLHIVDGTRDTTLSPSPAGSPAFVSDSLLLYHAAPAPLYGPSDIYQHVPGNGDQGSRLAANRHLGFGGYQISADRGWLLAARWSDTSPWDNELHGVRLDGGGEVLLASDLLAYQLNSLGLTPFVFTADGHRVIYNVNPRPGDSGASIVSVAVAGGPIVKLSNGLAFTVSPFADRVAIIDRIPATQPTRVRVVVATTGAETFAIDSPDPIGQIAFVPDDRGLVFVESPSGGPSRLRHLSFADGNLSLLGEWSRSNLPKGTHPAAAFRSDLAVDPTGCYAVVDSDLPGAVGTSLVILPGAP
jgi:hypothetical protein